MKGLFTAALTVLVASSALAGEVSYPTRVGAEVMISQVLSKQLLKGEYSRAQNRTLRKLLHSPASISAKITNVTCDRALGSDYCFIDIFSAQEESESNEQLRVRVIEGEVKDAEMTVTAG